ncbi:hypothetical protein [Aeribacillus composti]|uniref:hypothetical protein n=1 Tax=Aeribacillus composti TaxID=1868734 RepID=UPI002E1DBD54|nr:hypothetical protein [Aeribacillus composti]
MFSINKETENILDDIKNNIEDIQKNIKQFQKINTQMIKHIDKFFKRMEGEQE